MTFATVEPGADPIVVEHHFTVEPSRVFAAWMNPDIVLQWFGPIPGALDGAHIDLRPGGQWRFVIGTEHNTLTGYEGTYVEIEPNRLLVFTWAKFANSSAGQRSPTTSESLVKITFTPTGHGTEMRIVHSDLDTQDRDGFQSGWTRGVDHLAQILAR